MADDDRTIRDCGTGDPDRLQRLWSPHRMTYITADPPPSEEVTDAGSDGSGSKASSHPFLDIPMMSDEEGLIVARGKTVYAVMTCHIISGQCILRWAVAAEYFQITGESRKHVNRPCVLHTVGAVHCGTGA